MDCQSRISFLQARCLTNSTKHTSRTTSNGIQQVTIKSTIIRAEQFFLCKRRLNQVLVLFGLVYVYVYSFSQVVQVFRFVNWH